MSQFLSGYIKYSKNKDFLELKEETLDIIYKYSTKLKLNPEQSSHLLNFIFVEIDTNKTSEIIYLKYKDSVLYRIDILIKNTDQLSTQSFTFFTYMLSRNEVFDFSLQKYDELWTSLTEYLEHNSKKFNLLQYKSIFYSFGKVGIRTPALE